MKITKRQLRSLIMEAMGEIEDFPDYGPAQLYSGTGGATLRIDYRSPPSGLGTIFKVDAQEGEKGVLVQYEGSNPPIKPGHFDQIVLFTPRGGVEDGEAMQESSDYVELVEWLKQNFGVTSVIDTEMSFGNVDSVEREIPIDEWLRDVTAGW